MATAIFETNIATFLQKALHWSKGFKQVCLFQSNGFQDQYSSVEALLCLGSKEIFEASEGNAFKKLSSFLSRNHNLLIPGFFSYDLKNELEDLHTNHPNYLGFPDANFFIPEIIIQFKKDTVSIESENDPNEIFHQIIELESFEKSNVYSGKIKSRMSKEQYLSAFDAMQSHIQRGDIYEANLCQEFYDDDAELTNPESLFETLNLHSPTPFSSFIKIDDKYILSASPERFLAKRNETLISQPIKGTAARGKNELEDNLLKAQLRNNPKEIAENVMIVDLVRNDLTRSAIPGSVEVTEKLGIYSFKHVHQMISTVCCKKDPRLSNIDVIMNTFPAGSMTGAPKLSAMQLCERYENSRRGVYSGAIGYFAANGDFDFNVVIRTILYNKTNKYLSFHTGSAITIDANADYEYNECLTKASAILKSLDSSIE